MSPTLAERAPIYAWLASLLTREVDAETWARLSQGEVASILDKLDPDFETWVSQPWTGSRREALHEEFARLFLVPGEVPPLASVWMPGDREELGDRIATLVTRSFEAIGGEPVRSEKWGRLAPDHIAMLFDLAALSTARTDRIDLEVAAHLDQEAFGAWLMDFGEALSRAASSPLYRAVGRLVAELHDTNEPRRESGASPASADPSAP